MALRNATSDGRPMTIHETAERWARTWEAGWNELDVERIVALYAADALLWTTPFRSPYRGQAGVREYVGRVFGEEAQVTATFAGPIVGDERAAVPWWATLLENGQEITLAGTSVLRFDLAGLVVEQWDAWHQESGRIEPVGGPFGR